MNNINPYQNILEDLVTMEEPNEEVFIHSGQFELITSKEKYTCDGNLYFQWIPEKRIVFKGELERNIKSFLDGFDFNTNYKIKINESIFGVGQLSQYQLLGREGEQLRISGFIYENGIKGDTNISVSQIKFIIPNLKEIVGLPVNYKTKLGEGTAKGRIILNTSKYKIVIDRSLDFEEKSDNLRRQGGYISLYNGVVLPKSEQISHTESVKLTKSLSTFFSLINGAYCSCMFLTGIHEDEIIWEDFTPFSTDTYKSVNSWHPIFHSNDALQNIFEKFQELWILKNSKNFLRAVIHWYIESNRQSGDISGSIILAQTGLELIFNYWIVEQEKIIIGDDSKNLKASNKIRLILSQLNQSSSINEELSHLNKYNKDSVKPINAPELLVEIRNSIVHSTSERLDKILNNDSKVKYEALQLMIKYIELSILKILGYSGKYFDRCKNHYDLRYMGTKLPWSTNADS